MVKQGQTGTDLKWVDTVAGDLANTHKSTLAATVAIARGGAAIGDGDGGPYTWVIPQQLPPDGMIVVNPPTPRGQTPGSWKRALLSDAVSDTVSDTDVRRFGRLGAARSDAAMNAATINAAIAALPGAEGALLEIPAGAWPIDRKILIRAKAGITLRGRGRHVTTLNWVGGKSTEAMIELNNSRSCVIEEMSIEGALDPHNYPDPGSAPFAAIESRRSPGGPEALEGQSHVFRNLVINYSGTTKHGIAFTADLDNNNDFATFISVTVLHAVEACLALMHTQSVGHTLIACQFGGGNYAVACGLSDPERHDPSIPGGSFTWLGGGVSNSRIADFWVGSIGASGAVSITGVNSEASARFFMSELDHNVKNTISIRDCRISTLGMAPDRKMVFHQAPGPLTFAGCTFSAGDRIPIVDLTIETPTVHHITGNMWAIKGSDATDCIVKHVSGAYMDDYPGGQLVIEESNVFLNQNDQINSLGLVNPRRGVVTFQGARNVDRDPPDPDVPEQLVVFASPEPNPTHTSPAFPPTNPRRYYVATSVEIDETNPPAEASRMATINSVEYDSFRIRIGAWPGAGKSVSVHWLIMR